MNEVRQNIRLDFSSLGNGSLLLGQFLLHSPQENQKDADGVGHGFHPNVTDEDCRLGGGALAHNAQDHIGILIIAADAQDIAENNVADGSSSYHQRTVSGHSQTVDADVFGERNVVDDVGQHSQDQIVGGGGV